ATPVLFVETQMLFPETLAYQQELADRLGLTDVRTIRPAPADLDAVDPGDTLHLSDPDGCCHVRKVLPLERALGPFDAWITGRKRGQSRARAGLRLFETDAAGRIKLNPLAGWSVGEVRAEMARRGLPPHPLVNRGFPSIGCLPCTTPVDVGEDPRAGRWRGRSKEECGIHVIDGRVVRSGPRHAGPLDA
ncbi:MAG: phosphoadenylyl-sulfate reductase, partial [Pseudomonadota bacterium]